MRELLNYDWKLNDYTSLWGFSSPHMELGFHEIRCRSPLQCLILDFIVVPRLEGRLEMLNFSWMIECLISCVCSILLGFSWCSNERGNPLYILAHRENWLISRHEPTQRGDSHSNFKCENGFKGPPKWGGPLCGTMVLLRTRVPRLCPTLFWGKDQVPNE